MDKLSVFSKKLGDFMNVTFGSEGVLVTPEGETLQENNTAFARKNHNDNWVNGGWNNSSNKWQNGGWNNSSKGWLNHGWTNSGNRWQNHGWSNSSKNWVNGGTSAGCYITTACVEYMGLSDDCHELTILREYRDKLVAEDASFRAKVLDYYRKAPLIVQQIEKEADRDNILDEIYGNVIQKCVALLENGKVEEAKKVYLDNYENLVNRYLTD